MPCAGCGFYFWNASLQPCGVSGCGRSWTPSAECEASAAMDERLEVTILVMVTVSSSGGGAGAGSRRRVASTAAEAVEPREVEVAAVDLAGV